MDVTKSFGDGAVYGKMVEEALKTGRFPSSDSKQTPHAAGLDVPGGVGEFTSGTGGSTLPATGGGKKKKGGKGGKGCKGTSDTFTWPVWELSTICYFPDPHTPATNPNPTNKNAAAFSTVWLADIDPSYHGHGGAVAQ